MRSHRTVEPGSLGFIIAVLAGLLACSSPGENPVAPEQMQAAKAGAGPSVTAATPAYGNRGESGKQVTITGSGFAAGDQASWERNGAADPKVQVVATQFVSSTQLVATINIAGDAELAFYDIAIIRPGRKGGIGTMLFEVTQAVVIPATVFTRDVNLNGEVTGRGDLGPFFWSPISGLETLAPVHAGRGISADGLTIAGILGEQVTSNTGVVWTRSMSGWQQTTLPRDASGATSGALAIGSDALSGSALVVGGWEGFKGKGNSWRTEPRLWISGPGSWQRIVLPTVSGAIHGRVEAVRGNTIAVGFSGDQAAVWEPNGGGGWSLTTLGPGYLLDVNPAGTLAVGAQPGPGGDEARYWIRTGGTWTGPFALPGNCVRAAAVDATGRVVANICPRPTSGQTTAAVFVPPYSAATMIFLGGIGNNATGGSVEAMSSDGAWIVGQALPGNGNGQGSVGVYWKIF